MTEVFRLSHRGKAVQTTGESSIVTVDAAIRWIEGQAKQAPPFLAVVWFGSPHGPHEAIDEDRRLYDEQTEKLLSIAGHRTADDFHRELGELMIENCGMSRSEQGLKDALQRIPAIRDDFWHNISVPGDDEG